ncbi:FAD-dependent monooxygenase [Brachybacterium halotolerans subsp. kimchii]|uniref:FAD-dependent oxidoreductase n=1 Tax=Brachybacterium halotolerans TaxID=2795215 RepID=UPI001E2F650B|nr:FAD-dependent oxidoreductase [Brachybacterium halotolerans]UEJ82832.1 FAD-dependent monooxygenase [Brachybacterium halotolerans subsp. kimchii]
MVESHKAETSEAERTHDVAVIGGGPTGMMLAAELRLRGVDVVVLEREAEPSRLVRSLGLHARSIEILDQRGILERFLAEGTVHPGVGRFAGISSSASPELDTAHGFILGIPQPVTDRLLEERARELGADVRRGREVVALAQDADAVVLDLADGERVRARWAVACDGGRSRMRALLGIGFPGEAAQSEWLLGEMEVTASAEEIAAASERVRREHRGFGIGQSSNPGLFRAVVPAASVAEDRSEPPSFEEFRARLRAFAGTDFGAHSPVSLTRFTDATRLAELYRSGQVLLAGDAAHVHPPLGGQGLNLGIQDAFDLGWKLAAVVRGEAPEALLDTFEAERRPVASDVLTMTRAQSVLISGDPGAQALRRVLGELIALPEADRLLSEKIASLSIRYDLGTPGGAEDDLVGRRLRDMSLGAGRLYERMHDGRWLLVDPDGAFSPAAWADAVEHIVEPCAELPARAVLLRPDGHAAWAAEDLGSGRGASSAVESSAVEWSAVESSAGEDASREQAGLEAVLQHWLPR